MNESPRYEITDWHVIDNQAEDHAEGFYIREILDWACTEYKSSRLSNQQRYDMISELGLDVLTRVLIDCFTTNNKPYDAEKEAAITYLLLCRELGVACMEISISEDTSVGSFGVRWKESNIPPDASWGTLFEMRMVGVMNQSS